MHCLLAFLILLWTCSFSTFALDLTIEKAALVGPSCANNCTLHSLAVAHCSIDDKDCRCNNKQVNNLISSCIATTCSIEDAIGAAEEWAKQCDLPHGNHHAALRAAAVGSAVASLFIVFSRVFARLYTVRRLWWDDWSHIVAGIFTAGLAVFSNLMITEGMGYHLYDIHFSSPSQMKDLVMWYYICQIFWLLIMYFIKTSILLLYLRIFPEFYHFRFQVIGTMVFVTVAVVIIVPMVIWQCVPVHTIWDLKRENARCLSISGLAYASAAVNIFTEVLVLILPLPLLQTLRASRAQKMALYLLFGCGIIVIGVAAARIPSLSHVEDTHDPTYLNAGVIYWTAAETAVAHLCAAALAVRPLYVKCRNDLRRKRKKSSDSTATLAKLPGACVPEISTHHHDVIGGYGESGENHSSHGSEAISGYNLNPTCPLPLSKSTTEELELAV